MKIVVVSDNHGYDKPLDNIIKQNPDAKFFIHCGDSEMPEQLLSNFYAVRGNNDGFYDYPESIILDLDANNKAMIIHGHRHIVYRDLTYLANFDKTKGCNIVFYGHTHIFNDEVCDGIRCINPGSIVRCRDFTSGCYALVTIENNEISVARVNYNQSLI